MSNYKYKFSIIMAVYKVELFLREAVDSVIEQTIGFENVQLILVDDGSPDNSGIICDEYASKYPNNIKVIHKENGGVSSARNMGLEIAEGKYLNFLDSDDKWETDALEKVWDFFEKHNSETDVVALPIKFFDAATGNHMLNYKFNPGSRIVDLENDWKSPQMHVASAFFSADALKEIRFDTSLAYAEDAKLVQEVTFSKQTLGLFDGSAYLYRKRSVGSASAIQSSGKKPNWYIPVIKNFHLSLINTAVSRFGFVPKYLQNALMYELQWRLKQADIEAIEFLSNEEKKVYIGLIKEVLGYIDNVVILAQRNILREHKFFALSLKYGHAPEIQITDNDVRGVFDDKTFFSFSVSRVVFEFLEVKDNKVKVSGFVNRLNMPYDSYELLFYLNSNKMVCKNTTTEPSSVLLNNNVLLKQYFCFETTLESKAELYKLSIGAAINGKEIIYKQNVVGERFLPINLNHKHSHIVSDGWMISYVKGAFCFSAATFLRKTAREVKYFCELFKENYDGHSRKAAFNRLKVKLRRKLKKRPIWLISDRATIGGDNGEAMFRYMLKNHKEVDVRFVIDENAPDYERIKKLGPVVKRNTSKHKKLALLSEFIISSHAENEIYNPLSTDVDYYKDIWSKIKFVFLQHGVIQSDLSGWLGKSKKNFCGFTTSAKPEYKSIIDGNYGYTEKQIWLTGLPRFDRLYEDTQKIITLMPTWRRYLSEIWDPVTDLWTLVPDFEESDYFKFYNGLLNDSRLVEAAKKYGYKINFFPHPTLQPHIHRFTKNDAVEFLPKGAAYRDVYAKSGLVITDYSSAVFDFSYLRKPLIYTQFDTNVFYAGEHIAGEQYFDYERDGFGEVEYDLDSAVERIIEYMENGCKLKDKYRERIDKFFCFKDKNNCERVYEKLTQTRG